MTSEGFISLVIIGLIIVFAFFVIRGYLKDLSQGCCGTSGGSKVKRLKVSDRNRENYPYKAVLSVDCMVCSNCATRIENSLNSLPGVWATADVSANTVTVLMKSSVDEKILRSKVNDLVVYTVMNVKYE